MLSNLMKRTSPTEKDRQIQSSLGDFQCLKQLIERDTTHGSRLVGVSSSQIRSQPTFPLSASILQSQPHKIQVSSQIYPAQTRNHSKQVCNNNNTINKSIILDMKMISIPSSNSSEFIFIPCLSLKQAGEIRLLGQFKSNWK